MAKTTKAQSNTGATPLAAPASALPVWRFRGGDDEAGVPIYVVENARAEDILFAARTRMHRVVNQLQFGTLTTDNGDDNISDFLHAVLGQAQEVELLLDCAIEAVPDAAPAAAGEEHHG